MKIKSLVSLFLALTILATRVGYALNVHYCEDKIAKISLAYDSTNCNMESNFDSKAHSRNELIKKSCCENDIQLFQNHEPQKIDQEDFLKITIVENVFFRDSNSNTLKSHLLSKAHLFNSLSPPTITCKLFLKNNSFMFYG
tara:strand:+ start:1691 stop:2113 length:423 start_codon:yes stop_codon:yes gene_type:complete